MTRLRGGSSVDLLLAGLLLAVTALMLLPGALGLPMELWDESRVANNAIEMAKHGGWLVATFGGVPDHWELKPPLLVWAMAALLRTGMDPMLAIRLPSILATMGSVLLVYASCRMLLKDRLAGLIGGLLLVCSVLFMGDHVGRTGDYDALLCLVTLGFVICAGLYIDRQTTGGQIRGPGLWIAAAAALLVLRGPDQERGGRFGGARCGGLCDRAPASCLPCWPIGRLGCPSLELRPSWWDGSCCASRSIPATSPPSGTTTLQVQS